MLPISTDTPSLDIWRQLHDEICVLETQRRRLSTLLFLFRYLVTKEEKCLQSFKAEKDSGSALDRKVTWFVILALNARVISRQKKASRLRKEIHKVDVRLSMMQQRRTQLARAIYCVWRGWN